MSAWGKDGTLDAIDPRALAAYRAQIRDPERVHAMCEDYRAGAGTDVEHDTADLEAGRRITVPTLVLWGTGGKAPAGRTPVDVWRGWADDVRGAGIDSGHYLAEENPQATLAELLPFLLGKA